MNKVKTMCMAVLIGLSSLLLTSYSQAKEPDPKAQAFEVLQLRCNSCHRKQNPFRVFSLKNMDRQAKKINQAVFVEKRMPRGDAPPLTTDESRILKTWLSSLTN